MDCDSLEHVVHAFITTKLDYCNALLCGIPSNLISRLQRIQNISARIITGHSKSDHITPVLYSLHWLPVTQRIKFKTLVLVYKAMHGQAPTYLQDLIQCHVPHRNLRSADRNLLSVPFTKSTTIQNRAFSVAGPNMWNNLPESLRTATSLSIFKRKLKTHLFTEYFS